MNGWKKYYLENGIIAENNLVRNSKDSKKGVRKLKRKNGPKALWPLDIAHSFGVISVKDLPHLKAISFIVKTKSAPAVYFVSFRRPVSFPFINLGMPCNKGLEYLSSL